VSDAWDLPSDPLDLFRRWLQQAETTLELPNAMALATSTPEGRPSNRFVLLKSVDGRGLVFFTNYESRKAGELTQNPWAAAAIFWPDPRRQVRVEGPVEKITAAESDSYFNSRDRLSQIGATISPQSRVIRTRDELDQEVEAMAIRMEGYPIDRPANWGGYRIVPESIEFWMGRDNRLHDRFRYRRENDGWTVERLAP